LEKISLQRSRRSTRKNGKIISISEADIGFAHVCLFYCPPDLPKHTRCRGAGCPTSRLSRCGFGWAGTAIRDGHDRIVKFSCYPSSVYLAPGLQQPAQESVIFGLTYAHIGM
jgi:hypothetical protein